MTTEEKLKVKLAMDNAAVAFTDAMSIVYELLDTPTTEELENV